MTRITKIWLVEAGRGGTADCRSVYAAWRRDLKQLLMECKQIQSNNRGQWGRDRQDNMILTGSHQDAKIKRLITMNVMEPKLEYVGEVWENTQLLKEAGNFTLYTWMLETDE